MPAIPNRLLCASLMCAAPACSTGETYRAPASPEPLVAHLGSDAAAGDIATVRAAFVAANPGYDLEWVPAGSERLAPSERSRAVFVQSGEGRCRVRGLEGEQGEDVAVGDLLLLRSGMELRVPETVGLLVFELAEELPADLPVFIRPDWDPAITDVPGGCAEETGAYRRILLTWLGRNGPYLHRGLNAHRVRITDSFSHYHPVSGGFDEFYLVQMAQPRARVLLSTRVREIEQPEALDEERVEGLVYEVGLEAGDLVYLPRGTMHRGLGGVLSQVITVPGFRPGAEIGLDHHLRRINERFGLEGDRALPFHEAASREAVVK